MVSDLDSLKKEAAEKAASIIRDGMTVGLGTGSTADHATRYIAKRQYDIIGVPTSQATQDLASSLGIKLASLANISKIDLLIDGADEATRDGQMIKGGGGALLREKLVAGISQKRLYVMDSSKLVDKLGKFPLPVEVNCFGSDIVFRKLSELNLNPQFRKKGNALFLTDNNNYIIDCSCGFIDDVIVLESTINSIVGVVECGLFINIAHELFIAGNSGVEHISI